MDDGTKCECDERGTVMGECVRYGCQHFAPSTPARPAAEGADETGVAVGDGFRVLYDPDLTQCWWVSRPDGDRLEGQNARLADLLIQFGFDVDDATLAQLLALKSPASAPARPEAPAGSGEPVAFASHREGRPILPNGVFVVRDGYTVEQARRKADENARLCSTPDARFVVTPLYAAPPAVASGAGRVSEEEEVGAFTVRAADRLAGEVLKLTRTGILGTRTPAADALLDYASTRFGNENPLGKLTAALSRPGTEGER